MPLPARPASRSRPPESVRFPAVSGVATNTTYKVDFAGGSVTKTVSQVTGVGTWISLATFAFTRGSTTQKVTLTDQAGGAVGRGRGQARLGQRHRHRAQARARVADLDFFA